MPRLRLVLACIFALTLTPFSSPAVADTTSQDFVARGNPWRDVTQHYIHNWVFRSTDLNRCSFIEVEGNIAGSWRYAYGDPASSGDYDTLDWTNLRLTNPTIHATGWPISGKGCDSTKRWKMKANLSQGWSQASCQLKVSVSVGFPWSVSASPAYSCGDNRVGHHSSTEGPSTNTLNQYNSGAPIHFAETLASVRNGGVGFEGVISVRMHTADSSDLVRYPVNVSINK